jgi:hypothetical protein
VGGSPCQHAAHDIALYFRMAYFFLSNGKEHYRYISHWQFISSQIHTPKQNDVLLLKNNFFFH